MKRIVALAAVILLVLSSSECLAEKNLVVYTGLILSIFDDTIRCESKTGEEMIFNGTDSMHTKDGYTPQIGDLVYIRYVAEEGQAERMADYIALLLCLGSVEAVTANTVQMNSVIGPLTVMLPDDPDDIDKNLLSGHKMYFTAQSKPDDGQLFRECIVPNDASVLVQSYHGVITSLNDTYFAINPYAFYGINDADAYVAIDDDNIINVTYDKDTQYGQFPQVGDDVEVYFVAPVSTTEVYGIVIVQKMI